MLSILTCHHHWCNAGSGHLGGNKEEDMYSYVYVQQWSHAYYYHIWLIGVAQISTVYMHVLTFSVCEASSARKRKEQSPSQLQYSFGILLNNTAIGCLGALQWLRT